LTESYIFIHSGVKKLTADAVEVFEVFFPPLYA